MEKFYITTPIYYVNAELHIGHAFTTIFADSIARYQRLNGKEVYFLTGADEHGAKILRSAEAAGIEVKKFVNQNAEKFKDLFKTLNISNDDFIRTSDEIRHFPAAQKLWKKLDEAGDIYKANYKGLYCVGCEAFITEKDLVDGKCKDHNKEPEVINEENYFFRLSRYTDEIKAKIKKSEIKIIPETRKNEVLSLLREGFTDISFSRPAKDISWGVPVPNDATQTMYVWCDALTNYISALGYGSKDDANFKKFWSPDLHIIGKDILRFHTAIWPAMLISAKLSLPKALLAHGFITVEGKKMSKTLGNVINPADLVRSFGVDAVRYYFLSQISVYDDGDFSAQRFKEIYNGNLANGIGNLVQRTAKMVLQYFNGKITKPSEEFTASVPLTQNLNYFREFKGGEEEGVEFFSVSYVAENFILPRYKELMEEFDINKAINLLWSFISELDKYIDTYKPFILIKTDKEKTEAVLWNTVFGLGFFAVLLHPFLPETAEKIFKILGKESLKNLKLDKNFTEELKNALCDFEIQENLLQPLFLRKN